LRSRIAGPAIDYAKILKDLSDILFPQARKITLVQDNLNTHAKASLYKAFPPSEAARLMKRFEWHYTPNMAVGSTWRSPSSAFWPGSTWNAQ
jgi:hypothetical protein